MIETLKRLWTDAAAPAHKVDDLPLAVAALLVEVMRMDGQLDKAEQSAIIRALQQRFGLEKAEVHALIERAQLETTTAHDLHRFTSQVVRAFPTAERGQIVQQLWEVAMADGHADPHEEQLIRRAAELLGVSHRAFIAAKIAAAQQPR